MVCGQYRILLPLVHPIPLNRIVLPAYKGFMLFLKPFQPVIKIHKNINYNILIFGRLLNSMKSSSHKAPFHGPKK